MFTLLDSKYSDNHCGSSAERTRKGSLNPIRMVSEKLLPFHLKIVLLVCFNVVLESALLTINYNQNKKKCALVGKDFIGRSS